MRKGAQSVYKRVASCIVALAVLLVWLPAPAIAQSGTLTILFNADTRPMVPLWQQNPYQHEGLFATCSGLGSSSSVTLQVYVDGSLADSVVCDGTVELDGLEGHSVDISAVDTSGSGPFFHLLAYGVDTPTPTATPTPAIPFGCSIPAIPEFTWSLVLAGHYSWNVTDTYPSGAYMLPITVNSSGYYLQARNLTTTGEAAIATRIVTFKNTTLYQEHSLFNTDDTFDAWAYGGTEVGQSFTIGLIQSPHFGEPQETADICVWSATSAGTPVPTNTPTFTSTPLPTALPSQGTCSITGTSQTGGLWRKRENRDLFGYTFRITSSMVERVVHVSAVALNGTTVQMEVDHNGFVGINAHTVYVEWAATFQFDVQLCGSPAAGSTATPVPVFGTATPTRTPTPTRTATSTPTGTLTPSPSASPTATRTPNPTATSVSTCLTPDTEDSAECVIIGLEQTQIALQETMVAPGEPPLIGAVTPVITAVPAVAMETAIAAFCEKDPCYNLQLIGEKVQESFSIFAEADDSVCAAPSFPFSFTPGVFGIGNYVYVGFPAAVCWFIDLTTPIRNIMRFLSVLGVFFMLWKYYVRQKSRSHLQNL